MRSEASFRRKSEETKLKNLRERTKNRAQLSRISGKEQKTGLNSQKSQGKNKKQGSTLKNLRGKNEIMNLVRISSAVF